MEQPKTKTPHNIKYRYAQIYQASLEPFTSLPRVLKHHLEIEMGLIRAKYCLTTRDDKVVAYFGRREGARSEFEFYKKHKKSFIIYPDAEDFRTLRWWAETDLERLRRTMESLPYKYIIVNNKKTAMRMRDSLNEKMDGPKRAHP